MELLGALTNNATGGERWDWKKKGDVIQWGCGTVLCHDDPGRWGSEWNMALDRKGMLGMGRDTQKEGPLIGGKGTGQETGKRMANLELLRCVAMMMVVVLHYLGKGDLLTDLTSDSMGSAGAAAWFLESFCIVAVNVYMFISGYVMCRSSFKLSRLIVLWLQVWVYSVSFGIVGALAGTLGATPFDTHYLLTLLFPVSMGHYWFMTAYLFVYLLLPFVGMAAGRMSKGQLGLALGLLLSVFCLLKSFLPLRLEMDQQGYDCLWYLCVFLSAAYVRRFGVKFLEKRERGLSLYVGCCLMIYAGTMALREIYLRTGSLERMLKMCLEYNHILPFLAAAGLFAFFRGIAIQGRGAKVINRIGPYTLGVYLLHENLGLRYGWQKWFGAGQGNRDLIELLLGTLAAVVCVFTAGILVDMMRKRLFVLLHRGLMRVGAYRRVVKAIDRADSTFQGG